MLPKIAVLYTCVSQGPKTDDLVARFASTYHSFPPGYPHDLVCVCNGGVPTSVQAATLAAAGTPKFFPRKNTPGFDLDGYMDAARGPCKDYDMLLLLGESCTFWRAGWLARLVEAWQKLGPGMYGPFSSNCLRPHLQTTGFACAPAMFNYWPEPIRNRQDRMAFEHGPAAFWRRVAAHGWPVALVTWSGEYKPRKWREPENILWKGDQSALLWHCNHSDRFAVGTPHRKRSWQAQADAPFR